MSYRESNSPTIDELQATIKSLKGTIEEYQDVGTRQKREIRNLKRDILCRVLKGSYITILVLAITMTCLRWAQVKESQQELEKHYTKYHDSLIKRQEQSAAVKEQKKFDKQQGLVFSALNKWSQKYVDGSTVADYWCNIRQEERYDPNEYFKCALLFENAPYININCSTKKCYREFDK